MFIFLPAFGFEKLLFHDAFFGNEIPVAIGRVPMFERVATRAARADTAVEVGSQGANLRADEIVKFVFRNGFAAPAPLAGQQFAVFFVEAKRHCAQHNVEALKQHMVMRTDFGDVFGSDFNLGVALPRMSLQAHEKAAKSFDLFAGFGKLIEI